MTDSHILLLMLGIVLVGDICISLYFRFWGKKDGTGEDTD